MNVMFEMNSAEKLAQIIAENIKMYVARWGKTNTEISKESGVSYPVFSKMLNGVGLPKTEMLLRLADYFGCPISSLLTKNGGKHRYVEMPVGGTFTPSKTVDTVWVDSLKIDPCDCFAFRYTGDGMVPTIPDGSILVVKRTNAFQNNDLAVYSIAGDMSCKRYFKDDMGITLACDNTNYQPLVVPTPLLNNGSVKLLGRVVEQRSYFNRKD